MLHMTSHQLSISRSVLLSLPPLRKPTFPSTTSIFHLLPRLSLSLPNRRAQSFHSRFDSLSFSSTVSTSRRSSSAVQFPNSSQDHDESSSQSRLALGCGGARGGRLTFILLTAGTVLDSSSASKSSAERPSGMRRGALRRRFGVT